MPAVTRRSTRVPLSQLLSPLRLLDPARPHAVSAFPNLSWSTLPLTRPDSCFLIIDLTSSSRPVLSKQAHQKHLKLNVSVGAAATLNPFQRRVPSVQAYDASRLLTRPSTTMPGRLLRSRHNGYGSDALCGPSATQSISGAPSDAQPCRDADAAAPPDNAKGHRPNTSEGSEHTVLTGSNRRGRRRGRRRRGPRSRKGEQPASVSGEIS